MTAPEPLVLPEELATALSASEEAQQNWDAAPRDLQRLYIEHVVGPRRRSIRQARADDTAFAAKLDTLKEHSRGKANSWWHVFLGFLPF
jgi:hypothetical protein